MDETANVAATLRRLERKIAQLERRLDKGLKLLEDEIDDGTEERDELRMVLDELRARLGDDDDKAAS